ncbi:ribonucleases P/MRP protein subunit POP1 isoform X2 [Magnolia sinica]|uniref:ribonucleases P/MRP protein subunit POP1 isoform X2 n=1 Tax=Magnolia sinica TaxID=86752 RepID=UPI00265A5270|nr:ribonucleases P/MRP protein subunit POP1 isoform X2 [Magnolia sinica]
MEPSYMMQVTTALSNWRESLLKVFRMVMVLPPSLSSQEPSNPVYRGVCYGNAMLHHVGAPISQLIAPVTFMWRPFSSIHIDIDVENDSNLNGHCMSEKSECSTSYRQLWVWIHAAAFSEGFGALRYACQELVHENGASVNCFSLEGKLAKLEVMGAKAIQVLQKILHPVTGIVDRESSTCEDFHLSKCSISKADSTPQLQKTFVLEHAEHLPSHAIVSLTVQDPRDITMKAIESVPDAPTCPESNLLEEDDAKEDASLTSGAPNTYREVIGSFWLKPDASSVHFSDSEDLWTSNDQTNPPMEENLLCMEKHQRRLSFFNLDNTNSGTLTTKSKEGSARSCPILLLKNINNQRGSYMGWSIILPLSWVKAFWIPLVSHGARAIGLRERQWVSCDDGVPSFPSDFPDCKSYSCFMSAEATASDQRAELCPLAMRPLRVPIPPPWYCVSSTVKEGLTSLGDDQTPDVQTQSKEMVYGSSLVNPDTGNNNAASPEQGSFPGFIARTSDLLSAYLNEIHCCHLPLFPNTAMGKRIFSELMDKGRLSWAPKGVIQIPANRKLCFLRVLLHAYKEGVFEEGAVVCAPILTDLSLWTTRSDEQDGLKIPQSSIKSYFIQQQSGKWELQRPEDPVAKQSHRWPIGFVTTGFVRGSTKPVAEAFCEAALLAQLRGEQWSEMQEKGRPEIFVLVRNLRSAAYRLALATIVVEQQAEDMEFT